MKKLLGIFTAVFCISSALYAQPGPPPASTTINAFSIESWEFSISWQPFNEADGYVVVRSTSAITDEPIDGVIYDAGVPLGQAKVMYVGNASGCVIREVVADQEYFLKIYPYKDQNGSPDYYLDTVYLGSVTSGDGSPGSYYNAIDDGSASFVMDLTALLSNHLTLGYFPFTSDYADVFLQRDTTGVDKVINCQYSNELIFFDEDFSDAGTGYNREHRMPRSWMNFNNFSSSEMQNSAEGADYHGLAVIKGEVNSSRSNYAYGEVTGNPWSGSYIDYTKGQDYRGITVAEPRDDRKGDCARALMYMMVTYNGKYSRNWGMDNLISRASDQELSVLLQWHAQDPPDAFEIARNDFIASIQGSRNPFVDYPEWVDCIDFSNVSMKTECIDPSTSIDGVSGDLMIPNPIYDNHILLPNFVDNWQILNANGQTVLKGNDIYIQLTELAAGLYQLVTQKDGQVASKAILIP